MSKQTKYQLIFIVLAILVIALIDIFSRKPNEVLVYTNISTTTPLVQTYSTATSSVTTITSPMNYKSEVVTTFDGSQFHTSATSTPLTQKDIDENQAQIEKQQAYMQKLLQEQQDLFNQQEQMFQQMRNDFGM